jgi:hypothetical protein
MESIASEKVAMAELKGRTEDNGAPLAALVAAVIYINRHIY